MKITVLPVVLSNTNLQYRPRITHRGMPSPTRRERLRLHILHRLQNVGSGGDLKARVYLDGTWTCITVSPIRIMTDLRILTIE